MNAKNVTLERIGNGSRTLGRHFPLTVRTLDLLLVSVAYVLGLVAVDALAGEHHVFVVIYALFAMPIVLSVGLRLYRALARRLGVLHDDPLAQAG